MFEKIKEIDTQATNKISKARQEVCKLMEKMNKEKSKLEKKYEEMIQGKKEIIKADLNNEIDNRLKELEIYKEKQVKQIKENVKKNETIWINEIFSRIIER